MGAFGGCLAALAVAVAPTQLAMQSPRQTARVRITAQAGRALRVWASQGEISTPIEVSEGEFEAVYTAPVHGTPSYAAIAAWDDRDGEAAVAILALSARIELPVETEPGAQVVVAVGSRRVTTHADPTGHARVVTFVPPGMRRARVTATDAAGNANVTEVPIDVPRPKGLWVVAPDGAESDRRLFVFSIAPLPPTITVPAGVEWKMGAYRGVAWAVIHSSSDAVLTATTRDETTTLMVHGRRSSSTTAPHFLDLQRELGISAGPRYSGAFAGVALAVEGRLRIRTSPVHLGIDLAGLYAGGSAVGYDVQLGGFMGRAAAEGRLSLSERTALGLGLSFGGTVVRERRTASGRSSNYADGGPTLALEAELYARLGPGLLTIAIGFSYTPLVGLRNTNLDGGVLSVGYRAGL